MQPEQNNQPLPDNITALREGRYDLARHATKNYLYSTFAQDRICNPKVDVTEVKNDGFDYSCPIFSAPNVMGFEALGLDTQELAAKTRNTSATFKKEFIANVRVDDEELNLFSGFNTLSLSFTKHGNGDDGDSTPQKISKLVSERFAQSPAHQAYAEARQQLQQAVETPHAFAMEPFDPNTDPLGTLAFLEDLDLVNCSRLLSAGLSAKEILGTKLDDILTYDVSITKTNTDTIYQWVDSVIKTLRINTLTGEYSFRAQQNPDYLYLEKANQSQERSTPFVETQCAEELCKILDDNNLMFHPSLQIEMLTVGESDRYGSIYTQLSREVAKWINNPNRTELSALFIPKDPEFYGDQLVADMKKYEKYPLHKFDEKSYADDDFSTNLEKEVQALWPTTYSQPIGEATSVLVGLINQALTRDASREQQTALPVTTKSVQMREGACCDVLSYYIGATEQRFGKGLTIQTFGEVPLIEKTMGANTYLSIGPVLFNGVMLPKGALFGRTNDGFYFARLTMFAFDKPEDQIAVSGSELAKTLKNEHTSIKRIGGTTLNHLIAFS